MLKADPPPHAHAQDIPCDLIDWPPVKKADRNRDPAFAEKLALSIDQDGLLHPIHVRMNPSKPGRYIGVLGWHRHAAVSRTLKWPTIPAVVIDDRGDEGTRSMMIAENLYRNSLNKNQQAKAIADWHTIYEAKLAQYHEFEESEARKKAEPRDAPTSDESKPVTADGADAGSVHDGPIDSARGGSIRRVKIGAPSPNRPRRGSPPGSRRRSRGRPA